MFQARMVKEVLKDVDGVSEEFMQFISEAFG